MKSDYKTVALNAKKQPKEYAFSCFDNAVRFAYYNSVNSPEYTWYVVAGHNNFGIHYGYMSVDSDGHEEIYDFDSRFINGVELRIALNTAKELRTYMIENNRTRISPCVDQPERTWGNRNVRYVPDGRVSLAPEVHQVSQFIVNNSMSF